MNWLDHVKIGITHTGIELKDHTVQAINDTKVQGTIIFGGLFTTTITQSDVVAVVSGIGTIALIFKLAMDSKKSMAETRKIELEYEIIKDKERDRKKALAEAENEGKQPRRRSDY